MTDDETLEQFKPPKTALPPIGRAKAGSTHIMWVATPLLNNRQVHLVESDLIEALNPESNVARRTPPASLQAKTESIFRSFRSLIYAHRSD